MKHGLNTDRRIYCHLNRLLKRITTTCLLIDTSRSVFNPWLNEAPPAEPEASNRSRSKRQHKSIPKEMPGISSGFRYHPRNVNRYRDRYRYRDRSPNVQVPFRFDFDSDPDSDPDETSDYGTIKFCQSPGRAGGFLGLINCSSLLLAHSYCTPEQPIVNVIGDSF